MGEKLGVFLAHPKFQGLPAYLEVAGKDGHGPDADEIRKLRELHARATKKKRSGGSGRKRGTSARQPAARRTRG
jgi:hypothetical protein